MSAMAESERRADGGDRRLLPRGTPGRRDDDRQAQEFLTDDDEARISGARAASKYIVMLCVLLVIAAVAIRSANITLAPMLNDRDRILEAAVGLADGRPYLTYDLNIETRQLRIEAIRRLRSTPELAVLGASHWQEADASVAPGVDFYNAHVHRDYYEDLVSVIGAFIESGRLPPRLIITIRDNQFLPVSERTDFLWVPTLPYYRQMAERMGVPYHTAYASGLTPQLRQQLSLPWLWMNVVRYISAPIQPHSIDGDDGDIPHPTLSALLPDGSIVWSMVQDAGFTAERARRESLDFAAIQRERVLSIDPFGVQTFDAVLGMLVERGVEVMLAHPPYNPLYWDAIQGSVYRDSLAEIERLTQEMADRHGLRVIGSFDPYEVGCTADMYIDGEHSGPECLRLVVRQALEGQDD